MNKYDEYLTHEEAFLTRDSKEGKKERKIYQQKDRSKYKKTDQKKIIVDPTLLTFPKGRVLSITSEGITVNTDGKTYLCQLKGTLKKEKKKEKNLVTVGDIVRIDIIDEKEASIVHIEERYSTLARTDNLTRRKSHLIAANVDQVGIIVSAKDPSLKPTLVDRYIISAKKGNLRPIVIINKIDLIEDALEEEKNLFHLFIHDYSTLDFPLILVSAKTGQGLDDVRKILRGKTTVFSGQSGVGKSSILNSVLDIDLAVGTIVERTRKGAHTTTTATLFPLEDGGFCVDTPGVKSFGLYDIEPSEVASYFPEIMALQPLCKFRGCTHTHEPDCAVLKAVDEQHLSLLRYHSYVSLLERKETKHEWE